MSTESPSTPPSTAAIIANPVSGGGKGRPMARRARDYLEDHGVEVELYWTQRSGEARELARRLLEKGMTRIAGCGGDGTLNEIANALAGTAGVLGVLPAGRGNDLGRALEIPHNPIQAADIFLHGAVRTVDLGRIGGRYFNTIATLGFDAEVCRRAEENKPSLSGPSAYLYVVLKTLFTYQSPRVRLEGDFGAFEGRIFLAATANSPLYGGGMRIAPPARMDDGLFHLCLIEDIPRWRAIRLLHQVYSGLHVQQPFVRILPTRRLHVESRDPVCLYADGERMAEPPTSIEMAEKALRVMTPLPMVHS